LTAIAAILSASALNAPARQPPTHTADSTLESPVHSSLQRDGGERDSYSARENRDLIGNEVDDAVTQYRLDGAGELYEVHSPRTELPRLGPPNS
jgi:hypothetical protein